MILEIVTFIANWVNLYFHDKIIAMRIAPGTDLTTCAVNTPSLPPTTASIVGDVAAAMPKPVRQSLYRLVVCGLYMVIGPTIILLNKQIMASARRAPPPPPSRPASVARG